MMTVFLLWPGMKGYSAITSAKYPLFFTLSGTYLGLLALDLAALRLMHISLPVRHTSHTVRCLLLFGLFSIVSWLISPYRSEAFFGVARREGLVTILTYLALFLAVSRYARPRAWMVHLFGIAICAFCALCLIQLTGRNPLNLYPTGLDYYDKDIAYSGAFLGTLGNVGHVAALLCIAIPAFLCGMLRMRTNKRFWLLLPAALSLTVLVWMNVAAGIVGVLGAALIGAPVCAPTSRLRKRLLIAAAVVVLTALLLIFFFGEQIGGTVSELSALLHGRSEPTFGSGRLFIWRETWEAFCRRPFFGGGPDTLSLYITGHFERVDAATGEVYRAAIDTAHNEYLNILANQGFFALLAYLGALVCSSLRWIRRAGTSAAVSLLGCAVTGYCIQAFFGISICISAPFFWLSWALLENALSTGEPMIRKAGPADIDAVEAGYTELLLHEQAHGTNTNWVLGLYPTRATAESSLAAGSLYVLEDNGEVCASMICNQVQAAEYASADWAYPAEDSQVLVLHTLCIPPSKAGNGYGTAMVRFYTELGRQLGCKALRFDTWAENKPANALYRKLGFRCVGTYDAKLQGLIPEALAFFELDLTK